MTPHDPLKDAMNNSLRLHAMRKHLTPETKAKMSASAKARWANDTYPLFMRSQGYAMMSALYCLWRVRDGEGNALRASRRNSWRPESGRLRGK